MGNLFIAGATSFVGRAMASKVHEVDLVLQSRPGSKQKHLLTDPRRIEVDLADVDALVAAMQGCESVAQLIGTTRARFDEAGDYEEVDFGTTLALLEAAKRGSVKHFILLSSVGAGVGVGSYLKWKKKTEKVVRDSGIGYSILRPSYLAGDDEHPERKKLTNLRAFLNGFSDSPVGAAFATLKPMPVADLARTIAGLSQLEPQNRVYVGNGLFGLVKELSGDSENL